VCAVFLGTRDVGLDQVREGMAWWYRDYAHEQTPEDRKAYESAEDDARIARRGLWQDKAPIPPWKWRRR
jgi:endonuclease YncB( thermonuclease family)